MASTDLAALSTEARNPRSEQLDELSTLDLLTVVNDEDATVAATVRAALPTVAQVVDAISARFTTGGRLFYIGAGTSGRLGVLDASECPPTFSVSPELFVGLIAGGDSALRRSSEKSEDSKEEGARDLAAAGFGAGDSLVGIAASGRTPYVIGALEYARQLGGLTVALTCVAGSEMGRVADHSIEVVTGPEVLTGSTRMKAGTATKMVLNMISTGVMVRQGAVFGNLMVNVQPTNEKLVDRAERIIVAATGCDMPRAARLLAEGGSVKIAIAMQMLGVDRAAAEQRLRTSSGRLRTILPAGKR
ncbi:N-acetylmuramic acid 6-phosphate etherase [Granulicella sp. WH15]|uniref:N-acetylmuramic acid 6-phosphate etherase n=1 Tax=Granulicella sp. WH15 TaxID=2602070 RepID=UPI00136683FD|nr:N-acetylmuramic acid 6-phosphate etherase [Granulicella sp. WH15]QHN02022.1 N-acetylmuramic acid 6-phosphate etherase [Granulicella sp. WH15]